MLVAMAGWYQQNLDDLAAAEQSLEAAMAADPTNYAALRSLVALYGQRGDWPRAANYLTSASANASDPWRGSSLRLTLRRSIANGSTIWMGPRNSTAACSNFRPAILKPWP
jgi:protein involved in temperature-dependent protein secretion